MNAVQPLIAELHSLQRLRKAVLLAAVLCGVAVLLIADSRWPGGTVPHETIEWVGVALIVISILGRTWCSLYIGGRKVATLVDVGPYSVTRNPLYVFSVLGAAGVGAQAGSVLLALAAGFMVFLVFLIVVFKEEHVLGHALGAAYQDYLARVPRFLPKFSLWRDVPTLEIVPRRVVVTFFDALFFLLAIPIAEGIEYLHTTGLLPTLIRLP